MLADKVTLFLVSATLCFLQGAAAEDLNDAIYSGEQARVGRKLYERHCIQCHDRRYFGQVLRTWQGERLGDLFTVMRSLMPEPNPGSLTDREYLDITAYVLSLNRFPSGEQPLTTEALDRIKVIARPRR